MKHSFLIILTLFFLGCNQIVAQEEINLKAKDSVKTTINPLAPAKAAFYSAIIPGLGQAYNKKYWKIPLVYAGLGVSIYSYTFNQKKYHEFRDEYKKRLDGTYNPNDPIYGTLDNDRLIRGQKFHQRNRDLSALFIVGIYILNIVDANVDAHLMQFNVNDNLSLRPELNQNEIDNRFNTGLRLTFNF
ncbi:DUF5683 domain-containing protein [Flavobacterium chuncheonense]|uniref:DUF5683 domain-containing protein n=1 Tax=Flavobacterium chuncheonense TaxID=2026653 RepID=A0ABW5YKX6_9FLAO